MNNNPCEIEGSDLNAFPVLGGMTIPMVSNPQLRPGDNTSAESKPKLLIASLVNNESESSSTAQHAERADPFPQLLGSSKRLLNEASSNLRASFRQSEAPSLCANIPVNSESEVKDLASWRRAKSKGKSRWRPLAL
jgi:hypothetical protein